MTKYSSSRRLNSPLWLATDELGTGAVGDDVAVTLSLVPDCEEAIIRGRIDAKPMG